MQDQFESMSGPEFLRAVANTELANGLSINAQAFKQRADEWQRTEEQLAECEGYHVLVRDLEAARLEIADLTARISRSQAALAA